VSNALTGGAWLPGPGGVLKWTEGARPAPWQKTGHTACGSLTGMKHHRDRKQPPCDLCVTAERYYLREYQRDRKRSVA
jgi:hypothetical protein